MDPAKHASVLEVFLLGPDGQVVRAGKIPIVGDMADGMDNFKGHIELARAAGGQLLTADNDHLMLLAVAESMIHEIDARDRS